MVEFHRGEMHAYSFGTGGGDGGTYFFWSQSSSIERAVCPLGGVSPILTPVYETIRQPPTKTPLRTSFPSSPLLNVILVVISSVGWRSLLTVLGIPGSSNLPRHFISHSLTPLGGGPAVTPTF